MTRAEWNGAILAESTACKKVEGNYYFPPKSLQREHFRESDTRSRCIWKGIAHYYDIHVNGEVNRDAAWYYPAPSILAKKIRNHVAFRNGVHITD